MPQPEGAPGPEPAPSPPQQDEQHIDEGFEMTEEEKFRCLNNHAKDQDFYVDVILMRNNLCFELKSACFFNEEFGPVEIHPDQYLFNLTGPAWRVAISTSTAH